MKSFSKIIFLCSVIFIVVSFIAIAVTYLLPQLEFRNNSYAFFYEEIVSWGLLIAIPLTLFGIIKPGDSEALKAVKLLSAILIDVVCFFIIAVVALSQMCVDSTEKVLFIKKKDASVKILLRSFGCGATDSTPNTYHAAQIKEYPVFLWVIDNHVDTTQLNMTEWTRVPGNEMQ